MLESKDDNKGRSCMARSVGVEFGKRAKSQTTSSKLFVLTKLWQAHCLLLTTTI